MNDMNQEEPQFDIDTNNEDLNSFDADISGEPEETSDDLGFGEPEEAIETEDGRAWYVVHCYSG